MTGKSESGIALLFFPLPAPVIAREFKRCASSRLRLGAPRPRVEVFGVAPRPRVEALRFFCLLIMFLLLRAGLFDGLSDMLLPLPACLQKLGLPNVKETNRPANGRGHIVFKQPPTGALQDPPQRFKDWAQLLPVINPSSRPLEPRQGN